MKWYTSTWFKVVMFIIVVVVTYIFWPAGLYLGSAVATFFAALAYAVVVSVVINIAVKLLIRLGLSGELAAIVVFVAAIVFGAYNGAFSSLGTSAQTILNASNLALQAYSKAAALEMQSIQNKFLELQARMALDGQMLNRAEMELRSLVDHRIDAETIMSRTNSLLITLGESPENFYARTTGNGNVGVLIYELVSSFNELKLQLPLARDMLQRLDNERNFVT